MSDLVAWLRAQLDEEERDIQQSRALSPTDLHWSMPDWLHRDRMLAEIEAKRQIISMWRDPDAVEHCWDLDENGERYYYEDGRDPDERDAQVAAAEVVDEIVRLLALPYADRPGYEEVWKP